MKQDELTHLTILERRRLLARKCNGERVRTQQIRDAARAAGFASVQAAERGVNRVNRWDRKLVSWNSVPHLSKEKRTFFRTKEQLQEEHEIASSLSTSPYDVESLTEHLKVKTLRKLSESHHAAIAKLERKLVEYQMYKRERIGMTQEDSLSQEMGMVESYEGETLKIRRSMERRGCLRKVKVIQDNHEIQLRRLKDIVSEAKANCEIETNRETIRELHVLRSTGRCASHLHVHVHESKLCEQVLNQLRKGRSLNLARQGLSNDQIRAITVAVCDNPFIQVLELTENQVCDAGCASIAKLLFQSNNLMHLNLSHTNITTRGADLLFAILADGKNEGLKTLNLSGNKLGTGTRVEVSKLCATLKRYFSRVVDGLEILDLSFNQLDDAIATALGKVIEGTKQVVTSGVKAKRTTNTENSREKRNLDTATAFALQPIRSTNVDEDFDNLFASDLLSPLGNVESNNATRAQTAPVEWETKSLHDKDMFPWPPPMDYDGSDIESVASRRAATPNGRERAWTPNAVNEIRLSVAEFSARPMSSQGIQGPEKPTACKAARGKKQNGELVPCPIRILNLYFNRITTKGAQKIAKGLMVANRGCGHNIVSLNLGMNNIGDKFVVDLANVLTVDIKLEHVDISENQIRTRGWQTIGVALSQNRTLQNLQMAGMTLTEQGVRTLLTGLANNTIIRDMQISRVTPIEAFRTFPSSMLHNIAAVIAKTHSPEWSNTFVRHFVGKVCAVHSLAAWLSYLNAEIRNARDPPTYLLPIVPSNSHAGATFEAGKKVNVMQPFMQMCRSITDEECTVGMVCMAELNHSTHSLWYTVQVENINRKEGDNSVEHVEVSLLDFPWQDVVRVELKSLRLVEDEIAVLEIENDPRYRSNPGQQPSTEDYEKNQQSDGETKGQDRKRNKGQRTNFVRRLILPLSMLPSWVRHNQTDFSMCICPVVDHEPETTSSLVVNNIQQSSVPNLLFPKEFTENHAAQLFDLGNLSPFRKSINVDKSSVVHQPGTRGKFVVFERDQEAQTSTLPILVSVTVLLDFTQLTKIPVKMATGYVTRGMATTPAISIRVSQWESK